MTDPSPSAPVAEATAQHVVDVGVVAVVEHEVVAPEVLVPGLAARLRARFPSVRWRVVALDAPDRAPRPATLQALLTLGRRRLLDNDLDVVLVLTDTPAVWRRRRLRAHVSPVQQTAVLHVADGSDETLDEAARLLLATVGLDDDDDVDVLHQLAAAEPGDGPARGRALLGSVKLLFTLVRQNRPWLMTAHLSKTLTGAFAASFLAVVTPDFWLLADRMTAVRLATVTAVALAVLCGVLVLGGGLRERAGSGAARRTVLLHNAAVWISVAVGVATLYVGLAAVDLLVSVVVLPHRLLAETLGHPASWTTVLRVGALTSTVALVGSVFGAGLEDDEDVQEATYTGSDEATYANG
ncbi:MAG: hypothetical protein HOQ45_14680 [Nocardioidaceae bacterium]|nr:hypothetical protein [Nocardioidaceae bacterium]